MPKEFIEKHSESNNNMESIIPLFEEGVSRRKCNWTEEELTIAIKDYFDYCVETDMKPSKAGLRLYLGCSRSQYHAWQTEYGKYGAISDLINLANDTMEVQYVQRVESYPTGNLFLLRTSHGHVESSKVDISTDVKTSTEDIKDVVSKLGLDKPKSE